MQQYVLVTLVTILFYLSGLFGGPDSVRENGTQGVSGNPESALERLERSMPFPETADHDEEIHVQVILDETIVREGPDDDYSAITTIRKGDTVILLDRQKNWLQIGVGSKSGWIPQDSAVAAVPDVDETGVREAAVQYSVEAAADGTIDPHFPAAVVVLDGWSFDSYGTLSSPDLDPEQINYLRTYGASVYASILVGASPGVEATWLQGGTALKQRAVEGILTVAADWPVAGVNLQIETLPAAGTAFVEFTALLTEALSERGQKLWITYAGWAENEDVGLAEQLAELTVHADQVVLLAYLQEPPEAPGPLASFEWLAAAMAPVVEHVPAERLRIGLSVGGYHWPEGRAPVAISYQEAMELAAWEGAALRWHQSHQVPHFGCGTGEVWFENRHSIGRKLELLEDWDVGVMVTHVNDGADPGLFPLLSTSPAARRR